MAIVCTLKYSRPLFTQDSSVPNRTPRTQIVIVIFASYRNFNACSLSVHYRFKIYFLSFELDILRPLCDGYLLTSILTLKQKVT